MDHHVPDAIVNGLGQRGVNCLTAFDDRHNRAQDADLLQRATDLGRILVSFDVDLAAICAERQRAGHEFSGLVYGRQLHITIGQAIRDLQLIAEAVSEEEIRNQVVYIPL
jgi:hypothetical protein